MILPDSIATITAVSRGAPSKDTMYLKGISLKRGSNSFVQVLNGLVNLDMSDCFQVKIANTTSRQIIVRAGELLGHLYKACDSLKAVADATPLEIKTFEAKASRLANLANKLDPRSLPSKTIPQASESTSSHMPTLEFGNPDTAETEHLGWGPKTSDPGPDQIYRSDQLREIIDVDTQLNLEQREALYDVIEQNQAAFGFDGWLGDLKSEVHIELAPGMNVNGGIKVFGHC